MTLPLVCPACGIGGEASERFCARCGSPLVVAPEGVPVEPEDPAHVRARKVHPPYAEGELVRVARAANQPEAELISGLLLEAGVPSLSRRAGGFDVPDFLAAGPRDVLVPASGLEVARATLHAEGIAPAPERTGGPTRTQVLGIAAALLLAAVVTALIAWALLQAGG